VIWSMECAAWVSDYDYDWMDYRLSEWIDYSIGMGAGKQWAGEDRAEVFP